MSNNIEESNPETSNQKDINNRHNFKQKFICFWNKPIGKVVIIGTPILLLIIVGLIIYYSIAAIGDFGFEDEFAIEDYQFEITGIGDITGRNR